jgi:hypothetical protein
VCCAGPAAKAEGETACSSDGGSSKVDPVSSVSGADADESEGASSEWSASEQDSDCSWMQEKQAGKKSVKLKPAVSVQHLCKGVQQCGVPHSRPGCSSKPARSTTAHSNCSDVTVQIWWLRRQDCWSFWRPALDPCACRLPRAALLACSGVNMHPWPCVICYLTRSASAHHQASLQPSWQLHQNSALLHSLSQACIHSHTGADHA